MPETQGYDSLPGILAEIVAHKRTELAELNTRMHSVEATIEEARPPLDFSAALRSRGTVSLIAECKRRSPGAGEIRPALDPLRLTRGYEAAGAAALSVLTDERFFGGSVDDLDRVSRGVGIPVLRKDFTLDRAHVFEARAYGADAVLLIVRILDDEALRTLLTATQALGMAALVEVHDEQEVDRALDAGATIVGVNNRDLSTFNTDLETTARLLERIPTSVTVVSESGIRSRADVERLGAVGVDAILVGEALLTSPDPGAAAERLATVKNVERTP